MSIFFPSHVYGCVDRSIIGPDFDVVKRDPIADLFVGSDKVNSPFNSLQFRSQQFVSPASI